MSLGKIVQLLKDTVSDWQEDGASTLAAALAYYTVFALAPLLLIAISIAGLVLGQEAAQGQVRGQLDGVLGSDAAATIEEAVAASRNTDAGIIAAVIGFGSLFLSASGLFGQLQAALNTIWEVTPKPGGGILAMIKNRFLSMTMVLGIGFMLLVSLLLSAGLSALGGYFEGILPGGEIVWQAVNFVFSFLIITLLFAAIYKVLPDAEIAWRDVWVGAAVTSLLFTLGKFAIGLYLGRSSVGSTYGAAGSLLVLLVWVYYSAQILFLGAEFTQVYARMFGSRITPAANAVPLTEEMRAHQGRAPKKAVALAAATNTSAEEAARQTAHTRKKGVKATSGPAPAKGHKGSHNGTARHNGVAASQADGAVMLSKDQMDAAKQLLWAGLASGMFALTAMAARRVTASIYQGLTHEQPPSKV